MTVYRPRQRLYYLDSDVQVRQRVLAAAAANWWEAGGATGAIAVYQPKGADSYAASLLDLSGNGNDATEGVQPGWNATDGWVFDGNDDYLDSGIVIQNNTPYTVLIRTSDIDAGSSAGVALAGVVGSADWRVLLEPSDGRYLFAANATTSATTTTGAVIGLTKDGVYLDGALDTALGGAIPASTAPGSIYIGARNNANIPSVSEWLACHIQAVAIYNATLTADQVAAVTTEMEAL